MGKYTHMIFHTADEEIAEEHIPAEDLALLAEGRAGAEGKNVFPPEPLRVLL